MIKYTYNLGKTQKIEDKVILYRNIRIIYNVKNRYYEI